MSANTRQDVLARLATLSAGAVDLINKGGRPWFETEAMLEALQRYKDKTLGWVEPKLSVEDHRSMFYQAMFGTRMHYGRLLDSLCEFGVSRELIGRLKRHRATTLLELWGMSLSEFHKVSSDYYFDQVVKGAFSTLQRKLEFKEHIGFPACGPDRERKLKRLVEETYGLYGVGRAEDLSDLCSLVELGCHPNPKHHDDVVAQIVVWDGRVVRGEYYKGDQTPDITAGFLSVSLFPFVQELFNNKGTPFIIRLGTDDEVRTIKWTIHDGPPINCPPLE